MIFEIDIPDEIADVADSFLRQLRGEPVDDIETGKRILPELYAGGLEDWLPEVVAKELNQIPVVAQVDSVRSRRDAVVAASREVLDALKPTVHVVTAESKKDTSALGGAA